MLDVTAEHEPLAETAAEPDGGMFPAEARSWCWMSMERG